MNYLSHFVEAFLFTVFAFMFFIGYILLLDWGYTVYERIGILY